jgi:nitrate reductase (NAD(P)H)
MRVVGVENLPQGKYGTSISLAKALDEGSDIILAYRMNGQPLPPDHGYPLRLIVPGYIGGRMVKWLDKIEVALTESESHYHNVSSLPFESKKDNQTCTTVR